MFLIGKYLLGRVAPRPGPRGSKRLGQSRSAIGVPAVVLALALAHAAHAAVSPEPAAELPRPAELEPDIRFWTRVYTEVDTGGGFIHDDAHLDIVYEVLRFPENVSDRTRRKLVKQAKYRYRNILRELAGGKRDALSDEEARVLALWPEGVSSRSLREASRRLRFQLGQSDKFRAGLIRSGAWEGHIRQILSDMSLPVQLVALPHVESSFNPVARSHAGAAGLWQFTRSTGRRYMRIDSAVDERMDPYRSSVAAARLLSHNHAVTGTWPLALTAYNHGAAGVRRAARKLGTSDIEVIVRKYRSRRFGFASRNFYVAFLAAVDVHFNAEKYFGKLERHAPRRYETMEVPDYVHVGALSRVLGVDRDELQRYNPALRRSVWRGSKMVPRGYELRLPFDADAGPRTPLLAQLADDERYGAQTRDRFYKVRRGNTLAGIAARYNVTVDDLVALNGLESRHRIWAGQTLVLPGGEGFVPAPPPEARDDARLAALEPGESYTVRPGDSLWLIARRFGVDEVDLARLNGLDDQRLIYAGQTLVLAQAVPTQQPAAGEEMEAIETSVAAAGEAATSPEDSMPETAEPPADVLAAAVAESPADVLTVAAAAPPAEPLAGPAFEPAIEAAVEPAIEPVSEAAFEPAIEPAIEAASEPPVNDDVVAREEAAEPASPGEAEGVAPALPPEMGADPSDYSVAADGTIEVQATETLGHYAEWLDIRAWRLRHLNGMRYEEPVVIGQRLELDLSSVDAEVFEERRVAYHKALQETFFASYRISGTREHVVRPGDSVWVLSRRTYGIPLWLLRQYNPDMDLDALDPGTTMSIPLLEPMAVEGNAEPA